VRNGKKMNGQGQRFAVRKKMRQESNQAQDYWAHLKRLQPIVTAEFKIVRDLEVNNGARSASCVGGSSISWKGPIFHLRRLRYEIKGGGRPSEESGVFTFEKGGNAREEGGRPGDVVDGRGGTEDDPSTGEEIG